MNEDIIINKVAESGIITINLEDFYPKDPIEVFDLKPYLFRELILREKDFRDALKREDWLRFQDKTVLIQNPAEAIIPMWAHMLVASYLQPYAKDIDYGDESEYIKRTLLQNIRDMEVEVYRSKRVVVKGCGDLELPESAYILITKKLKPIVKSLMFGEACSTVPIYKIPLQQKSPGV